MDILQWEYAENTEQIYPIYFFVKRPKALHGPDRNKETWRLIGVEGEGTIALFGTDYRGRDLLTRILYGGRITLSIGLFGVFLSIVLGAILGVVSGYFGGLVDMVIQRLIEVPQHDTDLAAVAGAGGDSAAGVAIALHVLGVSCRCWP